MSRRTWQQKVGKRLMQHVRETTRRSTLREVKANISHNLNFTTLTPCSECAAIIRKAQS